MYACLDPDFALPAEQCIWKDLSRGSLWRHCALESMWRVLNMFLQNKKERKNTQKRTELLQILESKNAEGVLVVLSSLFSIFCPCIPKGLAGTASALSIFLGCFPIQADNSNNKNKFSWVSFSPTHTWRPLTLKPCMAFQSLNFCWGKFSKARLASAIKVHRRQLWVLFLCPQGIALRAQVLFCSWATKLCGFISVARQWIFSVARQFWRISSPAMATKCEQLHARWKIVPSSTLKTSRKTLHRDERWSSNCRSQSKIFHIKISKGFEQCARHISIPTKKKLRNHADFWDIYSVNHSKRFTKDKRVGSGARLQVLAFRLGQINWRISKRYQGAKNTLHSSHLHELDPRSVRCKGITFWIRSGQILLWMKKNNRCFFFRRTSWLIPSLYCLLALVLEETSNAWKLQKARIWGPLDATHLVIEKPG